jgi:hypothetical protein
MSGTLAPQWIFQALDDAGNAAPGALLTSFVSGTVTKTPLFADKALTVELTNPVEMDAHGRADFWLAPNIGYTFRLETAEGELLDQRDDVYGVANRRETVMIEDLASSDGADMVGYGSGTVKTALDGKEPSLPTGTSSQYVRGDRTLSSFASDVDARISIAGSATSADLSNSSDPTKGSALVGHEGQTLRAKILSVDGQIETLEAGQGAGGAIAKETRALLDADLAYDEGKVGIVTNDATVENNTTYRKVGASGSGSSVISSEGPLDAYKV